MSIFREHRFAEAVLVSGFITVGAVFAVPNAQLFTREFAWFGAAAYLLMLAVYGFNSWGGFAHDRENPRLALRPSARRGAFALSTALALGLGLALFSSFGVRTAGLALLVFCLWAGYSWPRRGLKYVPLAGTILHFIVGIAQFVLGYLAFSSARPAALAIGAYFGLIFAAGHVNHELVDRVADERAGIDSGAVRFGEEAMGKVFRAQVITSVVFMAALASAGVVAYPVALPFMAAGAAQLIGVEVATRRAVSERWLINRFVYRCAYAAAGLAAILIRA